MIAAIGIRCARCKIQLTAVSAPECDTVVSCPDCGMSDTHENASREAAEYRRQRTIEGLKAAFRAFASHHGNIQIVRAKAERKYRFIADD